MNLPSDFPPAFPIFAAMSDYTKIRTSYSGPSLDLEASTDPISLLHHWLQEATDSGQPEPNAMALCTVDTLGQPSSRMVLLRGLSEKGLEFFTNYTSQKSVEIADNDRVALLFYWPQIHRQIRVEGSAVFADATTSDAYFNGRPRNHQVGAWASPQSATIPDRKAIEDNVQRYDKLFENKDVKRPSFWGGYLVIPHKIEFWQGQESRLHDRYRFLRNENGWKIDRLAP